MMDLDRLYKSLELLGNWDRFLLIIDLGKDPYARQLIKRKPTVAVVLARSI